MVTRFCCAKRNQRIVQRQRRGSMQACGNAAGTNTSQNPALKGDSATDHESRFQRFDANNHSSPGALPQAGDKSRRWR